MKDVLQLSGRAAAIVPDNTYVVASARWLDRLAMTLGDMASEFRLLSLEPDEPLPDELLSHIGLLVIEVSGEGDRGIRRIERIRKAQSRMPIVAAVETADLRMMRALLRQGVSDAIALPFDAEELMQQVFESGARIATEASGLLSPLVCVVGAGGGAGASSILLHLGSSFASQYAGKRCCVIDLDLQFGELAAYTGVDPSRTITNLLEAGHRLDRDMLNNVVVEAEKGLKVLCAPKDMLPLEQVDVDQLLKVIALARREYDLVLVDMPPAWTNWSLSVAAGSDEIVIVTEQTLSSLRMARRCLDMFLEVGFDPGRTKLVVNRANSSMFAGIRVQDVGETLRCEIVGTIRRDKGELSAALDAGQLLTGRGRRSSFARDVDELARRLLEPLVDAR